MNDERLIAFERLLTIMNELREKCPWDREQTFESLRHLTIEETYELSDAILNNNLDEIKKELGDVLLHVVFYAKLGEEQNAFNITSVINQLCEKLIRRHPHIYGDVNVEDANQVKQNWEEIKQQENKGEKSLLAGVPNSMPSLVKALRMQEKAAQVGFDWETKEQVWGKVDEELQEFKEAIGTEHATEEMGDVLFALVNYARFEGINPDDALELTNKKFKSRFEFIEQRAQQLGKKMKEMTLEEMDTIWNEAKKTI